MDLLASLGLGGALPEQSTRLTHPSVIKALDEGGSDVRLGFNRCLACGIKLLNSDSDTTITKSKVVACQGCKRVSYCSASCQKMDCEPSKDEEGEEAIGHSPVVCALLNLCNDDEDAEEEMYNKKKKSSKKSNEKKKKSNSDQQKIEAAHYRVRTELESYPATLFNILSEGPDWLIESITDKLRKNEDIRSPTAPPKKKQRRGKRDRSSISPKKEDESTRSSERKRELVLHIVGASVDSELWNFNWNGSSSDKSGDNSNNVEEELLNAYGEAATNLTSYLNNLLEMTNISIRCIFVGPDCPKQKSVISHRIQVQIPDSTSSTLSIETHACYYGSNEQPYLPAPDAVIFFNPGFSCPDYDWTGALKAVCAYQVSSRTTPILITTNTELEGFGEIKYLLDGGYINSESLPNDVLEAVDYQATSNKKSSFFFGENPCKSSFLYCFFFISSFNLHHHSLLDAGLRVRQSGTMGNDLYVKSKWIIGGLLTSSSSSSTVSSARSLKKRKIETKSSEYESDEEESRKKKARRSSGNTKKKNPALI